MARKKTTRLEGVAWDSGPIGYKAAVFMKTVGWLHRAEIWEGGQSR